MMYYLCTNQVCGLFYREQTPGEKCHGCNGPLLKVVNLLSRRVRAERRVREILAALKTTEEEE